MMLNLACIASVSLLVVSVLSLTEGGILYPYESESRNVHSLDGIWNFRLADPNDSGIGHREKWYEGDLSMTGPTVSMLVPSSYNDITVDKNIRDHLGVVWYDKTFFLPRGLCSQGNKIWLRFGSVHFAADVYVNGKHVMSHIGGHLPFQTEVTSVLNYGKKNRISVAVNNTLTHFSLPQGSIEEMKMENGTKLIQKFTFDFFNYAGIQRSVLIYTTPSVYIDDISITTDVNGTTGLISYKITVFNDSSENSNVTASLLDRDGNYVIQNNTGGEGQLEVQNANFWWPYQMHPKPGYLYTLEVRVTSKNVSNDIYRIPVGIRKISWDKHGVYVNNKSIYIRGYGAHEDSNILGRGYNEAVLLKDTNLLKWIGANSYRTAHYPRSEEEMDMADKEGIIIINESPAVSVGALGYNDQLLETHKRELTELYQRDKNRPSTIIWCLANEPVPDKPETVPYFKAIAEHMKSLDDSRPIMLVQNAKHLSDKSMQFFDVIGFNRYNTWFTDIGKLDVVSMNVKTEVAEWYKKFNKPIVMTEYGADTLVGLHMLPEYMWSEEYEVALLSKHFEAFDKLREDGYFMGEMVWTFADFMTNQFFTRIGGNKKGLFTRDRQPKASAHFLRQRYWALAAEIDNSQTPEGLQQYVTKRLQKRDISEL